jgi:hypothetical protein
MYLIVEVERTILLSYNIVVKSLDEKKNRNTVVVIKHLHIHFLMFAQKRSNVS